MDPGIVTALHDAFKAALSDRNVQSVLATLGQETDYLGPQDYTAAVPGLMARERAIADKLGLRPS